jgi:asparagine synthase (glutamine-hydrolysing)
MIVRRLALPEWRCRDVGDELDLLGPVAQRVLLRHGVLYPPNVHIQALRFEEAAGGTFLTGHGGDQVLGAWPWGRLWAVLRGRSRPRGGDGRLLLGALAPPKLRARVLRGRGAGPALPWTRPNARSALARAWASDQGSIPRRWDAWAAWVARRRNLSLSTAAVAALAREAGVDVRHPLIDRSFLGALAVHAGRSGFPSRTAAMEALFSDLLPPSLLTRRHKAHFAGVLWAAHSRAFIGRWDGEGIPDGVVDRDALRRAWGGSPPHFGTAMLLQRAWLTSIGGRDGEEPLYGGVE